MATQIRDPFDRLEHLDATALAAFEQLLVAEVVPDEEDFAVKPR